VSWWWARALGRVGVIFWRGACSGRAPSQPSLSPSIRTVGVWMIGGLLVPYVVRRPGAALVGEWWRPLSAWPWKPVGHPHMASGAVQGWGGARVRGFRWRRFTGVPLYGAAALAGAFSIILDIFVWSYYSTTPGADPPGGRALRRRFVVLAGECRSSWVRLCQTGVLSGLEISRAR